MPAHKSKVPFWANRGYSPFTDCSLTIDRAKYNAQVMRNRGYNARVVRGAGETYCVMRRVKK